MKTSPEHPRILIVIPAFNEAGRIGAVLDTIRHLSGDILVIDDGSEDETAAVVSRLGFRVHSLPVNSGLTAIYATAETLGRSWNYSHILSVDADGQHDPRYIPEFLRAFDRYDLVSGTRFFHPETIPAPKIASNLFASLLLREILHKSLPDVACGFRGWRIGTISLAPGAKPGDTVPGRFGIVYSMMIRHLLAGKEAGFVRIPAIYHTGDPLNTKTAEIISLLSVVKQYPAGKSLEAVLEEVRNKRNFGLYLSGFRFEAKRVPGDAYVFETDHARAIEYFRNVHQLPEYER